MNTLMIRLKNLGTVILGLLLGASLSFAQQAIGVTTLSGALSGGSPSTTATTVVCLGSGSSVVLPSLASGTTGSILAIDNEFMQVVSAALASNCFNVKRGLYANSSSNSATAHSAGANVWILQATISTGDTSRPTSTAEFLSQKPYQPFYQAFTPPTSLVGTTATTLTSGKTFYGAIEVDFNSIFNGICVLNGGTVGGELVVAVYNAQGALIANSATAGTAQGTASQYACVPFTSPQALVGPAQYWVAVQGNGTGNVQMYAAGGVWSSYPTGALTGTFGTVLSSITVTNSFTAAEGPYATLY